MQHSGPHTSEGGDGVTGTTRSSSSTACQVSHANYTSSSLLSAPASFPPSAPISLDATGELDAPYLPKCARFRLIKPTTPLHNALLYHDELQPIVDQIIVFLFQAR